MMLLKILDHGIIVDSPPRGPKGMPVVDFLASLTAQLGLGHSSLPRRTVEDYMFR